MSTRRASVLVLDSVNQHALAALRADHDVVVDLRPPRARLLELVAGADAIVCRSGVRLDAEVLDRARQLRVICRAGVGVDNIDLAAVRSRAVILFNVPAQSGRAVAELAFALILSVARKTI